MLSFALILRPRLGSAASACRRLPSSRAFSKLLIIASIFHFLYPPFAVTANPLKAFQCGMRAEQFGGRAPSTIVNASGRHRGAHHAHPSPAELADYIRARGGEVAGIVSLVDRSRSGVKPAAKQHVRLIEERYGDIVRQEFGIEPAALTGDEALVILASRDADTLRDRVAKAKQERYQRLRRKGVRPPETEETDAGLEGVRRFKIK
jgi:hypothetical protein